VLAALNAGRDVFVEKPLAYTLRGTDAILEAVERADRVLMVGMMKRFDPGYRRGQAAVKGLRDLRYVDARTLNPQDSLYMWHHPILGIPSPRPVETAAPLYGAEFDHNVISRILSSDPGGLLEEATGSNRPEVLAAYALLVGSSVHDINALIGVLGRPERVVNAALWAGGTSFSSTLAFAGGVHATYTWTMLPYLKHYQGDISFYGSDGRVHIHFPSPYLRNEPTPIEIERMDGDELHVTSVIVSYEEAFKLELLHLHECLVERKQPLTSAPAFRTDLEVLIQIAQAFG
jgi:predicted dehydrogenase